jgi:hypothetical protein
MPLEYQNGNELIITEAGPLMFIYFENNSNYAGCTTIFKHVSLETLVF